MTLSELNDLSAAGACLLLVGTASAAIGYLLGKRHGREAGELAGSNAERQESTARIMKAKRDGFHSGRIHGITQVLRLIGKSTRGN